MTLRWTPEMLAAHTAKLRKAVESAPRPAQVAVDQKPKKRRQKYGNKVTTDAEGVKHASKKQATRYRDLGLLMKSGEIVMLAREVRFRLPGGVEYVADHVTLTQRALAVMIGHENGKVVMQFASPTAWIGFTPEQAMDIAQMLITHARQAGIVGVYTIKL